ERGTVLLRVRLQQRAGDAVTDRAGLAGEAAAGYGALHVKLAGGAGGLERLTADHLQGLQTEVVVDGAVVDLDLTGTTREQTNAGNGGLSSAGAVEISLFRCIHQLVPPLLIPNFGLLRLMVVVLAGENLETGRRLAADRVLRQHALDRELHRKLRLLVHQGLVLNFLQAADPAGV